MDKTHNIYIEKYENEDIIDMKHLRVEAFAKALSKIVSLQACCMERENTIRNVIYPRKL